MPDQNLLNTLIRIPIEVFKASWWFWLFLFIIWILKEIIPAVIHKLKLNKKFLSIDRFNSDRDNLQKLRRMSPSEFELYIADLYYHLGYKTERIGKSHDGGIDVIAEKDGVKHFIQCKKFISSKVRVGAVRDFYGAIMGEIANGKGIFITTNVFTTEAENFADGNLIELIDGYSLLRLIKSVDKDESRNEPLPVGIKAELCPRCGGELKERTSEFGKFFGCSNFPKCRYKRDK